MKRLPASRDDEQRYDMVEAAAFRLLLALIVPPSLLAIAGLWIITR